MNCSRCRARTASSHRSIFFLDGAFDILAERFYGDCTSLGEGGEGRRSTTGSRMLRRLLKKELEAVKGGQGGPRG